MSWQKILAQGFQSSRALLQYLELPEEFASEDAEILFKTRVPRRFAERMQKKDPHDPLLLQVLALNNEHHDPKGFTADPLQEKNNSVPGMLHKYKNRVLLTLTGVCAINCRYCFRRHFPYNENNPGRAGWSKAISYIEQDTQIEEVILSGGDPLMASNAVLLHLIEQLNNIPHLRTLRIHSRLPVVLPERFDDELLAILAQCRLQKVVVIHCNHKQEIDESMRAACARLRAINCTLLNQSVLLKKINDNAQTLAQLSNSLFACGVLPYYLHLLDKVSGAGHFDVSRSEATAIFRELQTLLPGYLVPRLACEEPGKPHKTLLI